MHDPLENSFYADYTLQFRPVPPSQLPASVYELTSGNREPTMDGRKNDRK